MTKREAKKFACKCVAIYITNGNDWAQGDLSDKDYCLFTDALKELSEELLRRAE